MPDSCNFGTVNPHQSKAAARWDNVYGVSGLSDWGNHNSSALWAAWGFRMLKALWVFRNSKFNVRGSAFLVPFCSQLFPVHIKRKVWVGGFSLPARYWTNDVRKLRETFVVTVGARWVGITVGKLGNIRDSWKWKLWWSVTYNPGSNCINWK